MRRQLNRETSVSKEWFSTQLDDFSSYARKSSPSKELRKYDKSDPTKLGGRPTIGSMYMYVYDPKLKDSLPFYDRFPLIILLGPAKNGFLGLNLHYLPPVARANFLDSLLDLTTTKDINESTRFRLTYNILKGAQQYRYFKPTIKHYLANHIKSQVKLIPPPQWIRSIFLDTAQFQKESKQKVYAWSKAQYK